MSGRVKVALRLALVLISLRIQNNLASSHHRVPRPLPSLIRLLGVRVLKLPGQKSSVISENTGRGEERRSTILVLRLTTESEGALG